MLRALLAALIVANLLFFAFTRGWFDGVLGLQSLGERDLGRRGTELAGDVGDRAVGCGQVAGGDGEPRDERDVLGGRVVQDVLALAGGQKSTGLEFGVRHAF